MEYDTLVQQPSQAKTITNGKYKLTNCLALGIFLLLLCLGSIFLVHIFVKHHGRSGDNIMGTNNAQFNADVGADTATPTAIGEGFYIPRENLLGESLISGYPILELDKRCIVETNLSITSSQHTYYKDTKTFYSQTGFESRMFA